MGRLTPLPHAKQPPPIYGPRGCTVPVKYINHEQVSTNNGLATLHTPPPEYCGSCSIEFATVHDMQRHLEQHTPCPVKECSFVALASIVEHHIEANHITGLYKTVRKVWTTEEISAWHAERCKRFPTATNVMTAKLSKEQRLKRGERLEASKLRFSNPWDRRRTLQRTTMKERTQQTKRQRHGNRTAETIEGQAVKLKPENTANLILKNGFSLSSNPVFMFCGTNQMKEYEHLKTKVISKQNALYNMLALYGTDNEYEDESTGSDYSKMIDLPVGKSQIGIDKTEVPQKRNQHFAKITHKCPPTLLVHKDSNQLRKNVTSGDEPDEIPIDRINVFVSSGLQETKLVSQSNNIKWFAKPASRGCGPQRHHYGLNYKIARQAQKQCSMLCKLLASDIHHERNILLQCVRYVCEQNFFNI